MRTPIRRAARVAVRAQLDRNCGEIMRSLGAAGEAGVYDREPMWARRAQLLRRYEALGGNLEDMR